jgi:hypothetical protein
MDFMAPIPGSSLTVEPGSVPWEQPPQYSTVNEALGFYFQMLEDRDVIDDFMFMAEAGMPLQALVNTITSLGVMNGKHTVDVKVLVMPIVHEHIKNLFEAAQIDFVEFTGPSREEKMKERDKERTKMLLMKALNETPEPSQENLVEAEEALEEKAPLIARRK